MSQADDRKALSRVEILDPLEREKVALLSLIVPLTPEEVAAESTPTDWSVKDHLAHLAAWENGIVYLLRKQNRWEGMGLEPQFVYDHDEDEINDKIYHQHRDDSFADVMAYFENAHQGMVEAVGRMTDEELAQSYSFYQPDEPGEDRGYPITRWIAGNSFDHYAEHRPWIEARIARQAAS